MNPCVNLNKTPLAESDKNQITRQFSKAWRQFKVNKNAERTGAQSVPVAMSVCFKREKVLILCQLETKQIFRA